MTSDDFPLPVSARIALRVKHLPRGQPFSIRRFAEFGTPATPYPKQWPNWSAEASSSDCIEVSICAPNPVCMAHGFGLVPGRW